MNCSALWIGGKDIYSDNNIMWINAEVPVVYEMWENQNQGPDHTQGDCVYLNANVYKLRLFNCQGSLHFVCEIDHDIQ